MRRTILHNLSTVCRRSNLLSTTCEATSVSNETLAAQFCTLTRGLQADVDTYVRSPLPDSSHGYLSHSCAHLLHRPEQLLSLKSFSSSAAIWHGADAPTAGITPLMQTPAPSSSTSVFTPQAAAAQPNRTAQAVLRKTKISPKKLNEFAKLIRRMHVEDALVQCQFAPNKAAKLCYKLLLSAKDNAEKDKGLDPDKLRVDRAFVGKGQYFKRMNTHARGRSGVRHVYHAHLTIILAEGDLKRVTQFRPPNAQWNKNRRTHLTGITSA